ncbi:hypothetical protein MHU86_23980 [Fragilaria crotonensis]|nr:hypothetical protein MHU86_23980 [Fragilaria crotonensis]
MLLLPIRTQPVALLQEIRQARIVLVCHVPTSEPRVPTASSFPFATSQCWTWWKSGLELRLPIDHQLMQPIKEGKILPIVSNKPWRLVLRFWKMSRANEREEREAQILEQWQQNQQDALEYENARLAYEQEMLYQQQMQHQQQEAVLTEQYYDNSYQYTEEVQAYEVNVQEYEFSSDY